MTKRSIPVTIILIFVTLGLYGIYWYCSFQSELKKGTGEGFSAVPHLLVTFVSFGIYGLYWTYVAGARLKKMGAPEDKGAIYLILSFIGLGVVAVAMMQSVANEIADSGAAASVGSEEAA